MMSLTFKAICCVLFYDMNDSNTKIFHFNYSRFMKLYLGPLIAINNCYLRLNGFGVLYRHYIFNKFSLYGVLMIVLMAMS